MAKPMTLSNEVIAKTDIFTVHQRQLQFSNGVNRRYQYIDTRSSEAVLIIPVLDKNTLLLVKEYAGATDDYVLAFPKGGLSAGEAIEECANRELMEEVGYRAQELTVLHSFYDIPGYVTTKMHYVLATGLSPKKAEGDEPEALEVVAWPLAKCAELLAQAQFVEARSVAALYLLEQQRS